MKLTLCLMQCMESSQQGRRRDHAARTRAERIEECLSCVLFSTTANSRLAGSLQAGSGGMAAVGEQARRRLGRLKLERKMTQCCSAS